MVVHSALVGVSNALIALLDTAVAGGNIDEKLAPVSEPQRYLGPDKDFAALSRCKEVCVLPEERVRSFCKVVEDMNEEEADNESKRCLQCDLRLKIAPVKFWGNY